jgi:hypothetical protein
MRVVTAAAALAISVVALPAFAHGSGKPPITVAPAQQAAAPAAPVDPASLAVAREILVIGFPPDKREQMFNSMIDTIMTQARQNVSLDKFSDDTEFQTLLDRSNQRMFEAMKASLTAAIPDYFDAMARAYARGFSADDLNAILAFVKTSAGQHYLERSSQLLKDPDVALASQRMTMQLMAKMPDIISEIMKDVQDYVAKKEKNAKLTHAAHAS